MAGIYVHIPFCKKACFYCDFHFTVSLDFKKEVLQTISFELMFYAKDFGSDIIESIYFGGGTPSVLSAEEIQEILNNIQLNYCVSEHAEITLEANPDDLTYDYLQSLKFIGINRLSIGIQSLDDRLLVKLNRNHDALRAKKCLEDCQSLGFDVLSVDIIYGIPGQSKQALSETMDIVADYQVNHISAYHLTIEPGTVFGRWEQNGKLKPVDERVSEKHFQLVVDKLNNHGFEQYEISNFCRAGQYAKHNSSYWKSQKYLGVGPSAHSFYDDKRRWNVSSNKSYVEGGKHLNFVYEDEYLDIQTKYNEFILTRLRTHWGLSIEELKTKFGSEYSTYFQKIMQNLNADWFDHNKDENVILSRSGMMVSNYIFEQLMRV